MIGRGTPRSHKQPDRIALSLPVGRADNAAGPTGVPPPERSGPGPVIALTRNKGRGHDHHRSIRRSQPPSSAMTALSGSTGAPRSAAPPWRWRRAFFLTVLGAGFGLTLMPRQPGAAVFHPWRDLFPGRPGLRLCRRRPCHRPADRPGAGKQKARRMARRTGRPGDVGHHRGGRPGAAGAGHGRRRPAAAWRWSRAVKAALPPIGRIFCCSPWDRISRCAAMTWRRTSWKPRGFWRPIFIPARRPQRQSRRPDPADRHGCRRVL